MQLYSFCVKKNLKKKTIKNPNKSNFSSRDLFFYFLCFQNQNIYFINVNALCAWFRKLRKFWRKKNPNTITIECQVMLLFKPKFKITTFYCSERKIPSLEVISPLSIFPGDFLCPIVPSKSEALTNSILTLLDKYFDAYITRTNQLTEVCKHQFKVSFVPQWTQVNVWEAISVVFDVFVLFVLVYSVNYCYV